MSNLSSNNVSIAQLAKRENVMKSIEHCAWTLKHVSTKDSSAPVIESSLLKKNYSRPELFASIRGPVTLKHINKLTIADRSAPVIDASVKIVIVERSHFLDNVLSGAAGFYTRLLGAANMASAIAKGTAEIAASSAHLAQAKANQLVGRGAVVLEATKEQAHVAADIAVAKAADMYEKGAEALEATKEQAHIAADIAVAKAADIYEKGAEALEATKEQAHVAADIAAAKAADMYEKGAEALAVTKEQAYVAADIAVGTAQIAAAKAADMYESGKELAQENIALAAAKAEDIKLQAETQAYRAQAKAGEMLETGIDKAADIKLQAETQAYRAQAKVGEMLETGIDKAASATAQAGALYQNSKELLSAEAQALRFESHNSMLLDIQINRSNLHHVKPREIKDRSKPFIPSAFARQSTERNQVLLKQTNLRTQVMSEIQRKATLMTLNHVSMRDASIPVLPVKVILNKADRRSLLAQVQTTDASSKLHSVTEICDRSAPVLPQGKVDLHKLDRKVLFSEVQSGVDLSRNTLIKDRSAPMMPSL